MTDYSVDNKMELYNELVNTKIQVTPDYVYDFLNKFIKKFGYNSVDINMLVDKVILGSPKEINLNTFYNFVADQCVVHTSFDPQYNYLASNILVERLHKATPSSFKKVTEIMYNNHDAKGTKFPMLSDIYYNLVQKHHEKLEKMINYERDYNFDYFGLRTLERSYLMKVRKFKREWRKVTSEEVIVERPSHLYLRVALFIHQNDLAAVKESYDLMMNKFFTHATPTLFNAGTRNPQLSSCYLLAMEDEMESITTTQKDIMLISKWAGGIGVHISSLRSQGSVIRGTNGLCDGIVPLCRLLNTTSLYVNQGGKRKASVAVYLEPHHPDVLDFIELRKNTGLEDKRCRDLFLALWISDLFMERVEKDQVWSFMCPDESPKLNLVYGEEYKKLYEQYEREGRVVGKIKARELFKQIMISQCETGFPYMCYKDHVNHKSNQKNLGTIRSSNLCTEIMEYSDSNETAVCNLVSICLPSYIKRRDDGTNYFDFEQLMQVSRVSVRNLNKVIDLNFYPTERTKRSNFRHRPMGIGSQGEADVLNIMKLVWGTPEALELIQKIYEHMYFACIDESKELAKVYGAYETFNGSPFSKGELQWHMWGVAQSDLSPTLDWSTLIEEVKTFGTRNSLLTALMPTASTSQIMGNYEAFEPYRKMIFVRTTLAGEFIVINDHLIKDLKELNLWGEDMRKLIIINDGSIQNIPNIPQIIKDIYRTAFEIPLKTIIDHSAKRSPFVDQSQSLNLFLNKPDFKVLASAHLYGWKVGLKTGMYYLHSNPAVNPIQFGIDIEDIKKLTGISTLEEIIGLNNKDEVTTNKRKIDDNTDKTDEPPTKMCKWTPGKKAEGCDMCSS
jgi:ribonucleoside-diphosphate reductase alpha chain